MADTANTGPMTFHLCVSVRGALRWPNTRLAGMFRKDGRRLKGSEVREHLMDQLAAGREHIPCDKTCANPCPRAGCAGFDYGPEGGCPGYPTQEATHG
ncbi:MAG TPA: hypothetical protein VGF12_07155 [Roseateles sp.]|uniref:hypothetical protein n=1 Tax=Roseateles sp. TaxID=1971397 RepID=UPI002ED8C55D